MSLLTPRTADDPPSGPVPYKNLKTVVGSNQVHAGVMSEELNSVELTQR